MPNQLAGLNPLILLEDALMFPISGNPAVAGTGISTLKNNTQPNIMALVQTIIQESSGWLGASNAAFGGLIGPANMPLVPKILTSVFQSLLSMVVPSGTGTSGILGLVPGFSLLTSLIPGLDFSKIISGSIPLTFLQPFINAISAGFGGGTGLNFTSLTSLMSGLLTAFPLTNITGLLSGGSILTSLIPGLDASKIITGLFSISQITNLSTLLGGFGTSSSIINQLINIIPGIGTGLTGLGGLGSIWTSMLGLMGNPTGLGTGTTVLPGIGSIPLLGGLLSGGNILTSIIPGLDASKIISGLFSISQITNLSTLLTGFGTSSSIISQLIAAIPGLSSGMSGLTGLGSIWTDILHLIGSPTALGGGTPVLPGITSIPLLGGLLSGGNILTSIIPGLDASKIVSGLFSIGQITNLTTLLTGFGTSSSIISQLIAAVPNLTSGLSGLAGLGSIWTDITGLIGSPTALGSGTPVLPGIGSIPVLGGLLSGGNILTSIIPLLDTSKISTGTFADAFLPGLGSLSDALFSGMGKVTATGVRQSDVNQVAVTQSETIAGLAGLVAQTKAGLTVGTTDADDFERTSVGANWTFLSSSGAGSDDGHSFHYSGTGSSAEYVMLKNNLPDADDRSMSIIVVTQALPSYPFWTPVPYGSYIDVWVRCTLFTTYATRSGVRLRIYSAAPYTASWSLDNIVNGAATNLGSGNCAQVGAGATISLEAGAGGTTRRYLGLLNTATLCDVTDVSTTTIDASHRYRGFGGKGNSGFGPALGVADIQQWTGE